MENSRKPQLFIWNGLGLVNWAETCCLGSSITLYFGVSKINEISFLVDYFFYGLIFKSFFELGWLSYKLALVDET